MSKDIFRLKSSPGFKNFDINTLDFHLPHFWPTWFLPQTSSTLPVNVLELTDTPDWTFFLFFHFFLDAYDRHRWSVALRARWTKLGSHHYSYSQYFWTINPGEQGKCDGNMVGGCLIDTFGMILNNNVYRLKVGCNGGCNKVGYLSSNGPKKMP